MDSMPEKPSFRPSEMDAEFAATRGERGQRAGMARRRCKASAGEQIGVGVAVGVVIGVVIGLVFGNFVVGIVIGIVLGAAIGVVMDR